MADEFDRERIAPCQCDWAFRSGICPVCHKPLWRYGTDPQWHVIHLGYRGIGLGGHSLVCSKLCAITMYDLETFRHAFRY